MRKLFKATLRAVAGAAVALSMAPVAQAQDDENRIRIIGSYARVGLSTDDHDFQLLGKVDTGADSTSIDAREIEEFERDDQEWVRFQVPLGEDDERMELELPVVDTVTIVGAGDEDSERLVVEMDLCVGDVRLPTEVNLVSRDGLDYRLLVGREYLVRGGFLVNPAQSDDVRPLCGADGED
ncbi:ATP-dependent zinc protease [Maribius pontilimi]|uniref:ATP-dependent zinc protease n=1 Tax=Palleronia pontilimi TaxID=1964209 RepID=A0A934IG62_9RHOB|nr:RimK/LysX family protein [Palleronia pontilimi]MBJ3762522.1 ATP-dependent zinc protease [Palleronia pontilimi]